MTKTKNIRKFVKVIKPGTAKYRGGGPLSPTRAKKKKKGVGKLAGTTQKLTYLFLFSLLNIYYSLYRHTAILVNKSVLCYAR